MVYKVSKGGVRSGNTLRGLHTLRTKRYSLNACLLGRSSLPRKDVNRFLEKSTDNEFVSSTLGTTNVLLSLNKKRRWLLPATVSHMIKTGSFKEDKVMISLLERHKLKRRANCVSFVCNKGRVSHVAPKQKRYFSFNLDNLDEDQSNREKRRQKAEALKRAKIPKQKILKDKSGFQTVQVYTTSGHVTEKETRIPSSKPEYRLEVYYPCPQSCSLTFNPKYTDVVMEMGEDGQMEVRPNTKSAKSRRRHRVRFGGKDVDSFVSDFIENDVNEMWEEEWQYLNENSTAQQNIEAEAEKDASCQDIADDLKNVMSFYENEEVVSDDTEVKRSHFSENILASLIAQAEKARSLCGGVAPRHRRKSTRVRHDTGSDSDDKSHIIYSDEGKPASSKKSSLPAATTAAAAAQEIKTCTLHTARVILSSEETSSEQLKEKYGQHYSEAESTPRRFAINVTDDVQNLLSTSRNAGTNATYTSYLVFTHDGFYDDGFDTYKVFLNSNITEDTEFTSGAIPFEKCSMEEIMNRIVCALLDMKENKLLKLNDVDLAQRKKTSTVNVVNESLKVKVESFHTFDEITRAACTGAMHEKSEFSSYLDKFSDDLDMDMFCEICYENVNPTQMDAAAGTQLTKCGHRFCDECWRSHLHTKSRDGAAKLTCPGYQCDITVGPVTLLSLLHISEVSKILQRACEDEVETSPNAKWCPNPECGRVIRLNTAGRASDFSLDVTCACGTEVCFSCLSPAHWPATCDQAEDYLDKLATLKPPQETTDDPAPSPVLVPVKPKKVEVIELEGRFCPKCRRFIEKNGGCPHMMCKCGFQFCWTCMKSFSGHTVCKPNPALLYEYIRKVKVRHVDVPNFPSFDTPPKAEEKEKKPVSARQRVSMYQKAVQQRLAAKESTCGKEIKELAKSIGLVAQKDSVYKNELLSLCCQETKDVNDASLALISVLTHVTRFLRSCQELRGALHHVAEFTFVLLQDAPNSVDKRRALALANDLSGYCSFIRSILELGSHQDARSAVRRLADIQTWARRAIGTLLSIVDKLRY